MTVVREEVKMVKYREDWSRHWPERGHRDIPPVAYINCPVQERISNDGIQPVEQALKRLLHLRLSGLQEAGHVGCTGQLRWQHIRDGGEANARRLLLGADEAKPLVCYYKGDEEMGFRMGEHEFAEVHHGVDVASAGIRHGHHVARVRGSDLAGNIPVSSFLLIK
ncbi:hypothetical protein Salat_0382400 [Sesamum alatum]|uniref:Uncharacterized protein n=1 Tax=Sesamum alatum TaxID=300844 RepID=A0AAE1Z1D6_9LAMI|nr:hypothetical protein Salat_0382400 [Sesamum alatum]